MGNPETIDSEGMPMRMESVEVHVGQQGHVVIKQAGPGPEESLVLLHPMQVDLVIEWLRACKDQAMKSEN